MLHNLIQGLLDTIGHWGYPGIFLLMAMESTIFPVPSELVLIPAGYLAQKGEMNALLIILASTLGSWAGASLNYAFAMWVGRPFLEKYGKYFLIKPSSLQKTDMFFIRHGSIATFTGRLVPVIRHLISIPAGITRMNFTKFSVYTSAGAALWSSILVVMGYVIGDNEQVIKENIPMLTISVLIFVGLVLAGYYTWQKKYA